MFVRTAIAQQESLSTIVMKTCNLHVKDFCNVKFDGLDPILRKRLVSFLKYTDPNAKFSHAFKLKRWDGKISFFSAAGATYFNMLPMIVPMIMEEGYEINVIDDRPEFDWQFPEITEEYLADSVWPEGHVMAGEPIMLREHQVRAINGYLQNWQSMGKIATGAGKTVICATMSKVVEEVTTGRTLVIVPSKSLVVQTEADYKNIGLDCGVYFGDRKELNRKHTICTWQSLSVLNKKGSKRTKNKKTGQWQTSSTHDENFDIATFLNDVVCVIVDEAHGAKAKELKEILCGPMAHIPLRWGMTGTVPKEDYQFAAVLASIGEVVIEIASEELIAKGVLAKCNIDVLQLKLHKLIGDFPDWDSEKKYFNTNKGIMEWLANFTEMITENGSTLLLVENIETGKTLEKMLPNSAFVYGNVDVDDRKVEYTKVDTTKNSILIATYGVAAVGISMTFLYNVILFNAGKSAIKTLQSIGRGLRKGTSEEVDMDKHSVQIYDVTGDLKYLKRHLSLRKSYYKEEKLPFTVTKVDI